MTAFLADENFPGPSLRNLRAAGVDVAGVIEDAPGASDLEVLRRAADGERILLTFDRDFGELIFLRLAPAPPGVVYLRIDPASPAAAAEVVLELLRSGIILVGMFTVVTKDNVRQRPLR